MASFDERILNGISVLSAIIDSLTFAAADEVLNVAIRSQSIDHAARGAAWHPSARAHHAICQPVTIAFRIRRDATLAVPNVKSCSRPQPVNHRSLLPCSWNSVEAYS